MGDLIKRKKNLQLISTCCRGLALTQSTLVQNKGSKYYCIVFPPLTVKHKFLQNLHLPFYVIYVTRDHQSRKYKYDSRIAKCRPQGVLRFEHRQGKHPSFDCYYLVRPPYSSLTLLVAKDNHVSMFSDTPSHEQRRSKKRVSHRQPRRW